MESVIVKVIRAMILVLSTVDQVLTDNRGFVKSVSRGGEHAVHTQP